MSIAKNITSKTWLSGLSDAFDVLSDPERYGKRYFQRMAGSMAVPSLINQASQATDPHMRDARTILDAIKARVPVLSESIPARLNIWGEPIERGDAVGPDFFSPFNGTKETSDPTKREIARIGAPLAMPGRSLMVAGQRVQLDPDQYADYVELTGKAAKAYLDQFVRSPEWQAMTDDERREEVKEAFEEFRGAARDELKLRYPELAGGKAPPLPPGFELAS